MPLIILSRGHYWLKVLRNVIGLNLSSQVNIIESALFDLASLPFYKRNPITMKDGVYYLKPYGLVAYARSKTEDLYFLTPGREGIIEDIIRDNALSGNVFIDVGANVGYYTILSAKLGSFVYSFEPVPETFALLKLNVKINGLGNRVSLHPNCAYDKQKVMRLFIPEGRYYGLSTLRRDLYKLEGSRSICVKCVRIDSVLSNIDRIGLVKIDVEGAELNVLKGMERIIDNVDSIILEVTKDKNEITRFLNSHGFVIEKIGKTSYYYALKRK